MVLVFWTFCVIQLQKRLGGAVVKFDPKTDFTYRQKLMRICLDRGISTEKLNEIVAPMRGCSHEQKEHMAKGLIPVIESGVYDCYPRHFFHKTEWYSLIHKLYDEDNISYDTVRPIVEDILQYCSLSDDAIKSIFLVLNTEEHLRQMYNWLMDQHFVPEESVCISKAREINTGLKQPS